MGIFGKNDKQSTHKAETTVISAGTFIRGGIETTGSIFIDGKFEGVVVAGESLTVGKNGEVIGEVRVKTLTVSGLLDGLINVEDANILTTGKILGKMQYQKLIIEENGVFEGEGKMKNSNLTSQYNSVTNNSVREMLDSETQEVIVEEE